MDRVTQRRKQSNRLIAQRYLLQTELVSNSAGTLYQARDLRASATATAAVLIHILPTNALLQIPLKLMTERLQALSAQTDAAVLKVLDSGWLNSEPYFVLASPPSWSLSALPPMLGPSTRLHEQALRLNQQLTEQGLLTSALPTSLFLVSADGLVYLPSTALAPRLQTFTESPELLLQAQQLPKRIPFSAWPWLGLGVIGVVAASSAGWYYQNYWLTTQAYMPVSTEAANSESLLASPAELDLPRAMPATASADQPAPPVVTSKAPVPLPPPVVTSSLPTTPATPIDLALTNTQILPNPEPGDMRLALASEQHKPQAAPIAPSPVSNGSKPMQDKKTQPVSARSEPTKVTQSEPEKKPSLKKTKPEKKSMPVSAPDTQAEFVEEADPAVNLPSPAPVLIRATEASQRPQAQFVGTNLAPNTVTVIPTLQPVQTINTAAVLGVVNPAPSLSPPPAPVTPVARLPAPERDSEALTANGMTSDELVKKAYQALQANHLDEQANRGAVYFIRLLERIDHGNPQIIRLAREISYQLHQQVRVALIQGDSEQASQKLWRAGRIIKEFNLVHLNPAQEILEHKLAE
ncbi:hypothetical protein SAMN02745130_02852 [Thiothrix eikelboomii]|uniref:Uncharacterized protein n=1 Tax=Thiothrix eikelboomii TaxID=92487 RepID=A0A1T4XDM2_9GAMM|nr:hypothetical protein [Thiothrix eikelboomii]SKA87673.1 hypothetical protein SAMN02745130_02852 [Thiothrix eikelboomii]